jgi:hypothetical protein
LTARGELFAALAAALDVRFQPVDDPRQAGLDALLVFGDPREVGLDGAPPKRMVLAEGAPDADEVARVEFSGAAPLDPRLRGRTLGEDALGVVDAGLDDGWDVLARADGRPLWATRRDGGVETDVVACAPAELPEGGYLRDELTRGRFARLLPIVHFLREVTRDGGWRQPPLRATYVVDDPNLHWPSYGYVKYPELVAHARRFGYHIAMAMVPLDAWLAHPGTVDIFRANRDVLSLCFHGNDHRKHDLGRPATREQALRLLGTALHRMRRFEARTGLEVARVMIPPHEACSEATMEAMVDAGFEAASATRPYLWMPWGGEHSAFKAPWPEPLSGWHVADLMRSGLPVLLRRELNQSEDVLLAAFLDKPLVLYAHAWDFEDGLEPLERSAAHVNSIPGVRWQPLSELVTGNFAVREDGTTLHVRPFSRRIRLQVAEHVEAVALDLRGATGFAGGLEVRVGDTPATVHHGQEPIELAAGRSGTAAVELRWRPERPMAPDHAARSWSLDDGLAVVRRVASETRDRLQPLLP